MPTTNNLIVRWSDTDGNKRSKRYTSHIDARKAYQWLLEQGADDADLAVEYIEKKPVDYHNEK